MIDTNFPQQELEVGDDVDLRVHMFWPDDPYGTFTWVAGVVKRLDADWCDIDSDGLEYNLARQDITECVLHARSV